MRQAAQRTSALELDSFLAAFNGPSGENSHIEQELRIDPNLSCPYDFDVRAGPEPMSVNQELSTLDLLKMAADNHHQRITLTAEERADLIALLKKRAQDELEYGQELEHDTVRLIRRVTGAVGLYFSK